MTLLALARLSHRKLLKITGPDCYPYLQGLVCNDVRYLYELDRIPTRKHAKNSINCLSTFMLNAQGRAICDLILYRTQSTLNECKFSPPGQSTERDELLIECDASLATGLANTLYGYRVRRKIEIEMEEKSSLWCLFPQYNEITVDPSIPKLVDDEILIEGSNEVLSDKLTIVNDPRLTSMGLRIISEDGTFESIKRSIQTVIHHEIKKASLRDYTLYRYSLGIGEGVLDHPESNCLPLECNADLLGSISFTKGCYLGQELTARIHYTGVVRKRLMPIILELESQSKESDMQPLADGTDIMEEGKRKKIGVLRHSVGNRALALLRHDLACGGQLIHSSANTRITAREPYWWR